MAKNKKQVATRKVALKGNVRRGLVMPIGHPVILTPKEMRKKKPEDFRQ